MSTAASLPAATHVGTAALTVRDVRGAVAFYEQVIGLHVLADDGDVVRLGAPGGPAIVELHGDAAAPEARGSAGLFHLAVLLPDRRELGRSLARLLSARWPLQGASDHWVSEALYLGDPEGNGIELYRDRPRDEWPRTPDGEVRMTTEPLDLQGILDEAAGDEVLHERAPAGTTLGHVHLSIGSIPDAEAHYHGLLGLDVMTRFGDSASFLAAGGYHHHLGLNTWNRATGDAVPGAAGLRHVTLVVPDEASREDAVTRARAGGAAVEEHPDGVLVRDPQGLATVLTVG